MNKPNLIKTYRLFIQMVSRVHTKDRVNEESLVFFVSFDPIVGLQGY